MFCADNVQSAPSGQGIRRRLRDNLLIVGNRFRGIASVTPVIPARGLSEEALQIGFRAARLRGLYRCENIQGFAEFAQPIAFPPFLNLLVRRCRLFVAAGMEDKYHQRAGEPKISLH